MLNVFVNFEEETRHNEFSQIKKTASLKRDRIVLPIATQKNIALLRRKMHGRKTIQRTSRRFSGCKQGLEQKVEVAIEWEIGSTKVF